MGQKGKPVIKVDKEGNTLAQYENAREACQKESLTKAQLYNQIAVGSTRRGHTFKFGYPPSTHELRDKPKKKEKQEDNPFPWEQDGVFCPTGWAQACIY